MAGRQGLVVETLACHHTVWFCNYCKCSFASTPCCMNHAASAVCWRKRTTWPQLTRTASSILAVFGTEYSCWPVPDLPNTGPNMLSTSRFSVYKLEVGTYSSCSTVCIVCTLLTLGNTVCSCWRTAGHWNHTRADCHSGEVDGAEGGTHCTHWGAEGGTHCTHRGAEGGTHCAHTAAEGGTHCVHRGAEGGTHCTHRGTEGGTHCAHRGYCTAFEGALLNELPWFRNQS